MVNTDIYFEIDCSDDTKMKGANNGVQVNA